MKKKLIPQKDIMDLVVKRCFPESLNSTEKIGERKIHYKRTYRNIQIIIFEGKHEWPHEVALDLIPIKGK